MKKPRRKAAPPKPIPEPAPLLTYEEAIAGVLKPWFDGKDLGAGTRIANTRDAAVRGLLAALNVNEGQRGVVRILVQSAEQRREVINFLTAFLTDEPRLKRLLKRSTPDTFFLNGGISIVVDANAVRLGKDVIAQIVLDPSADEAIASVWWYSEDETREQCAVRHGYKPEDVPNLRLIRWRTPAEQAAAEPPLWDVTTEPGPPVDKTSSPSSAPSSPSSAPDPIDRAIERAEAESQHVEIGVTAKLDADGGDLPGRRASRGLNRFEPEPGAAGNVLPEAINDRLEYRFGILDTDSTPDLQLPGVGRNVEGRRDHLIMGVFASEPLH